MTSLEGWSSTIELRPRRAPRLVGAAGMSVTALSATAPPDC